MIITQRIYNSLTMASAATMEAPAVEAAASVPLVPMGEPHPLNQPWVLWFEATTCSSSRITTSKWMSDLKEVAEINTVEDFWGVFNNVMEPSKLQKGSNYFLFKKGVKPCWEDPKCESGGRWVHQLKTKNRLDAMWLNLSM
jgi:translation initiation factor 4E